jgi:hypothetical protein
MDTNTVRSSTTSASPRDPLFESVAITITMVAWTNCSLIGMHGTTVAVEAAQRWEIAIQSVIREVIAIKYPKGRP